MSESAMLIAVQDHLRSSLGYQEKECAIEYDGAPPAIVGEFYISVVPVSWSSDGNQEMILDERVDVDVFVIKRITVVPADRRSTVLLGHTRSIDKKIRPIMRAIHMNYTVMNAATTIIQEEQDNTSTDSFHEPLRWSHNDAKPTIVPGSWFGAKGERTAGMYRVVHFKGAKRYQKLDSNLT